MLCLQQPAPILPDHALLARTSCWAALLRLLVSTALRRSEPALIQQLDCFVASVQDEVAASHGYWEELRAALAAQRASRPEHVRVVRHLQCLHCAGCKLLVQA